MILSEFNYEEEKIPSTIGPDDRPGHSIYYQVPDLGYPSSVELSDGTIFTVYYQSCSRRDGTTIIGTNWKFDN
ncbi:MAG: hypothetical protein GQ536_06170 [Candidatus Aminicenantes bacterium]|nr:hypothetical protein [Candidatus Aminicenantes bacterium]